MLCRASHFVVVLAGLLASCASGPKFAEVSATFPVLAPGHGRVFFCRLWNPLGLLRDYSIQFAGKDIGEAKNGTFFYIDMPAGEYMVRMTDGQSLVKVAAGAQSYVFAGLVSRQGYGVTFLDIRPRTVDSASGLECVSRNRYVGEASPPK